MTDMAENVSPDSGVIVLGDFSAAQDKALSALLAGATILQAARSADVSERTAHRWLADPLFKRRLLEGRAALQQRNLLALAAATTPGINALVIAASGWEEYDETNVVTGETRRIRARVPWTARIQAAAKLVELGVGSLARVQVEIEHVTDRGATEDALTARLAQYAETAPPEFRTDIIDVDGHDVELPLPEEPVSAPLRADPPVQARPPRVRVSMPRTVPTP